MIYFAYGSNLDEVQMKKRCPGSRVLSPARLEGHRLVFTGSSRLWKGAVATVVEAPGASVPGLTYEITHRDLASLDRFEGYPRGYLRSELPVTCADGSPVLAVTYYVPMKQIRAGEPSQRYVDVIRAAYRKWGLEEGVLRE